MGETHAERMTRVGHVKLDEVDTYVGRGAGRASMGDVPVGTRGWLGNPYPVDSYGLDECLDRFRSDFEERLQSDEEFREAVRDLSGDVLGCWCRTLDSESPVCHGDIIAEWADSLASEEGLDE